MAKCLDGVLPALDPEDEVILSVGRSTDDSEAIAARYAADCANVRIVKQKGRGLSDARNCAIAAAGGDYILCVDSDDYVETAELRTLLTRMRTEDWREDVVAHDFRRLEGKTGKLVDVFQIGPGVDASGLEYLPRMLKKRQCFWNVWRYIYKREFLEQNGIQYLENRMSEDVAYTTDVLLAKPSIRFVHSPFYVYTVGKGGSLMDRPDCHRLEDTVYVLGDAVERLRQSDFAARGCVSARFQFEYLLNMALAYEIDRRDRAAALALFAGWRRTLAGSTDWLVRLCGRLLRLTGVRAFAFGLHELKILRRWMRRFKRGRVQDDYYTDAVSGELCRWRERFGRFL